MHFRFTPEDRELLDRALARGVGVEHARPTTQGFGFGLRSALGQPEPMAEDEGEIARRVHLPAVEC